MSDAGWSPSDIDAISMASVFADPYLAIEQQALAQTFGGRGGPTVPNGIQVPARVTRSARRARSTRRCSSG